MYLSNEKNTFADNSRVEPTIFLMEKLSFSVKLFSGHFYGQFLIKTVRGPFDHLGLISYPLIVSKFHKETHDLKGQENKIYTKVKGREAFYRRHTVPVTSCSEVKYVLKTVSFGRKECTKEMKLECAYFLCQTS